MDLLAKVANPSVWARLRGRTLADFQASLPGVEILLVQRTFTSIQ